MHDVHRVHQPDTNLAINGEADRGVAQLCPGGRIRLRLVLGRIQSLRLISKQPFRFGQVSGLLLRRVNSSTTPSPGF